MQWKGKEQFYEHLERTQRLAPAHRRPVVLDLFWLFRAWRELSTCRPVGFSVGPIPLTAIFEYVDRFELPPWSIDALLAIDARILIEVLDEQRHEKDN